MEEKIESLATPETETKVLREALLTQQQLLQKLYAELDKEREASASAATETLSMILRLQGEKAAMTMESSQYRRMAEEKMGHADESITILEDVIYQKEMLIWSLEYQIQAYKYKLLSLGMTEDDFPKGSVLQENGAGDYRDGAENCIMRRLKSMPAMALKDLYKMRSAMEGELRGAVDGSGGGEFKGLVREKSVEVLENLGFKDLKPYWEQIRELDERVKVISKIQFFPSSDLGKTEKEGGNGVLDIFEVPETSEKGRASWPSYGGSKKTQRRLLAGEGNRIGKESSESSSPSNNEAECVKHAIAKYDDGQKKAAKLECGEAGFLRLKEDVGECQSQLQKILERVERLEEDRNITREEMKDAKEEDRNLLREIMEQLNSIQSGMESLQPKKPSSEDSVCLPLKEAMLHFWL